MRDVRGVKDQESLLQDEMGISFESIDNTIISLREARVSVKDMMEKSNSFTQYESATNEDDDDSESLKISLVQPDNMIGTGQYVNSKNLESYSNTKGEDEMIPTHDFEGDDIDSDDEEEEESIHRDVKLMQGARNRRDGVEFIMLDD